MFGFGKKKDRPAAASAAPASPAAAGGASTGCLLCGAGPAAPPAAPARCALCGGERLPAEACASGHALCEPCLTGPVADVIERACAASDERDPVALALRVLRHPRVRPGPSEYDQLVPSVLVAAWTTARGEVAARAERVREARARVPARPAGRPDGRGAAAGAGTFVALAAEAAGGARDGALVDRAIARAQAIIGSGADAACERRNALVAVLAAARVARELGTELPARGLSCENAGKNPSCVGAGCPFNR